MSLNELKEEIDRLIALGFGEYVVKVNEPDTTGDRIDADYVCKTDEDKTVTIW